MAIRQAVFNRDISPYGGAIAVTWTGLTQSGLDTGNPISAVEFSDKTFIVTGTLGAAGAVLIEGSNDGVNWQPMSNRQGTAMSFTALGMNTSQDRPVWVRPRVTAGDGTTSLTVSVACHRSDISGAG